jgi:hypothetical protein
MPLIVRDHSVPLRLVVDERRTRQRRSGALGPERSDVVAQEVSSLMVLQRMVGNAAVTELLAGHITLQRDCCAACSIGGACEGQETAEQEAPNIQALGAPAVQRTIGDGDDLTSPRFARDPVLEACYDDEARLTRGARGGAVSKVQQALIDRGYDLGRSGADGIFGNRTWDAVKQFKANERLGWEHMGDVGPGTMHRLDALFPGGGGGGGDGEDVECGLSIVNRSDGEEGFVEVAPSTDPGVDEEIPGLAPEAEAAAVVAVKSGNATVVCDGSGGFRVDLRDGANQSCGLTECTQQHEESHKQDLEKDVRTNKACKGKADGSKIVATNLSDKALREFLIKTECKAYARGLSCVGKKIAEINQKPKVERDRCVDKLAKRRTRDTFCAGQDEKCCAAVD